MAILNLPKHQAQIDFGRQRDDSGQLPPVPGTAHWYLAAHEREHSMAILALHPLLKASFSVISLVSKYFFLHLLVGYSTIHM